MSEPPADDEGATFSQEYDPRAKEATRLTIYCRLCRRIFPVTFKARPQAKLRCLCGHEAPLSGLDVFGDETKAREFATLYERLYTAAKQALRDANLPVPPTGRFDRIRDGEEPPSDIASVSDESLEDMSDITSSYVGDGSDERDNALEREAELRKTIDAASDVLDRHDALTELVEHLYCLRHSGKDVLERFVAACREDMALAKDVVKEATRRKKSGEKVRVTFSSFKHLAIALEDEGDAAAALDVCEAAIALGLGGYAERAARLKSAVGPRDAAAPKKPSASGKSSRELRVKRSRDSWEVPSLGSSGGTAALPKESPPPEPSSKKAPPKKAKTSKDEESPPIGLLSSSSDAIIPASADLDDLLPEADQS